MRPKAFLLAAGLVLTYGLVGCGGSSSADGELGDTTTKDAVERALESTGYEIRYRKVPRVEGYDMVAGRARNGTGGVVDFSVVIDNSGPVGDGAKSKRGSPPQFPIIRYAEVGESVEVGVEIAGNIGYVTQGQSGLVLGRLRHLGLAWIPSKGEDEMSIRIGVALDRLFAPGVIKGP